jgi:hypothetical protein
MFRPACWELQRISYKRQDFSQDQLVANETLTLTSERCPQPTGGWWNWATEIRKMKVARGLSVAIGEFTHHISPLPSLSWCRTRPYSTHNMLNRIYISGDTLMVDDLKAIPEHYKGQNIDLMLIHLGGTTIPSPSLPLLMNTMDAKQGLELVKLVCPDMAIPIHYEWVTLIAISASLEGTLWTTLTQRQ